MLYHLFIFAFSIFSYIGYNLLELTLTLLKWHVPLKDLLLLLLQNPFPDKIDRKQYIYINVIDWLSTKLRFLTGPYSKITYSDITIKSPTYLFILLRKQNKK